MATKIYHSREELIGKLFDENERIDYSADDNNRIINASNRLDDPYDDLIDAVWGYIDADATEGEDEYARRHLIEKWALMQANLSKLAWVFRIDGNEAYQRMIDALRTGDAADMREL